MHTKRVVKPMYFVYLGVSLYVLSGICQPLCVDLLKYQGFMGGRDPTKPSTHMGVLLNMLGMVFVGLLYLLRNPWPSLTWKQYRNMGIICSFDLLSQAMVMYGQLKVGGGLYVVLYSSCTVWTALLSRFLLGRRLRKQQWMGVAEVTGGLILSKINMFLSSAHGNPVLAVDMFGGSLILLGGAMLHSLTAVATEWLLLDRASAQMVSPMALAGWMGLVSSALLIAYNVWLGCVYGFRAVYIEPVEAMAGSWAVVCIGIPLLLIANAVHSGSFFFMISSSGAVSAGIMKGVQAVAVFALSATIFCSFEESQCVTVMEDGHLSLGLLKIFAMYMVVRGVVAYSISNQAARPLSQRPGRPQLQCETVELSRRP